MVAKKYCAVPWVSALLKADGSVHPCCYAPVSLGDWHSTGLKSIWHSEAAADLRQCTTDGKFINEVCRSCYDENRTHSLTKLLSHPFNTNAQAIAKKWPKIGVPLRNLRPILEKTEMDPASEAILSHLAEQLASIETDPGCDAATLTAIKKIYVLMQTLRDFLLGNNRPSSIAPFRAATVIGICNARCVQCPMKFNGEIQDGYLTKDGKRERYIDYEQLLLSLVHGDDILSFFPVASEILIYPHWKSLAIKLRDLGVKLRFSTNGSALVERNVEFLIDNAVLAAMTFSIDAATKSTYDNLRVNLKFETIVENIKYFFHYAAKNNYSIHVGFSFCLMKRNYSEMAGFVDLVDSFRLAGENKISVGIGIHSLQQIGPKGYLNFMRKEHHSTIEPISLGHAFAGMQERADALGIQVTVFNKYPLPAFNNKHLAELLAGNKPFVMDEALTVEKNISFS